MASYSCMWTIAFSMLRRTRIHTHYPALMKLLMSSRELSSLHLAHAFNQIPMRESDIEKTAFRTGTGGLYDYTRMPFGLCNAPGTFMRLMDKAFGDLNCQILLVYLDHILVFGSSFEETLSRLETVLFRLSTLNLEVKPAKCQLFCKTVRYLGHVVTREGTSPDPEKVRVVSEWLRGQSHYVISVGFFVYQAITEGS